MPPSTPSRLGWGARPAPCSQGQGGTRVFVSPPPQGMVWGHPPHTMVPTGPAWGIGEPRRCFGICVTACTDHDLFLFSFCLRDIFIIKVKSPALALRSSRSLCLGGHCVTSWGGMGWAGGHNGPAMGGEASSSTLRRGAWGQGARCQGPGHHEEGAALHVAPPPPNIFRCSAAPAGCGVVLCWGRASAMGPLPPQRLGLVVSCLEQGLSCCPGSTSSKGKASQAEPGPRGSSSGVWGHPCTHGVLRCVEYIRCCLQALMAPLALVWGARSPRAKGRIHVEEAEAQHRAQLRWHLPFIGCGGNRGPGKQD